MSKIIFKDDKYVYYMAEGIERTLIYPNLHGNLSHIHHLDNVEVLYHYIDDIHNKSYPVYYEYDNYVISKFETSYFILSMRVNNFRKDNTLANMKILGDEDII